MRRVALLALCGCGFSGGSNSAPRDAGTDAPPVEACDPLELRLAINDGADIVDADPPPMVLRLGDAIEIDGSRACGREGAPAFAWTIPSSFAGDTGSQAKRIVKFAVMEPGLHTVALTISDSAGSRSMQLDLDVRAIDRLDYIPSANDGCNGLALTTGNLWVACNNGVYLVDLADPHAPGVGNVYATPPASPARATRVATESDDFIWYTDSLQTNRTFRYDVQNGALDTMLNTDTGVTGTPRQLFPFSGGVRVLTTSAIWRTGDGGQSWAMESPTGAETMTESTAQDVWSGDEELVHVSASGASLDVFAGDDDSLRGMVFAAGDAELWVGGDPGAALVVDGAVDTLYTTLEDVREMAVDPITGDIWATSDGQGLYRYSRRLEQWLQLFGQPVGLESNNVRAVVVDTSGGRDAVYIGTNNGLHVLTTSFVAP